MSFGVDTSISVGSKFTFIDNPIASDSQYYGGEFLWQLARMLSGHDVSNEENIRINTPFKFYSGKFIMYDDTGTRTIAHYTEPIAEGNNKTIMWRALAVGNDMDYPLLENHPATIKNKILGEGTTIGANLDLNDYEIDDIKGINIRDLSAYNIDLIRRSGSAPNTHIDILADYNTLNYPLLSTASDIGIIIGHNSEIDKYEFWSKATGSNIRLLSLTPAEFNINVPSIHFNNASLVGMLQDAQQLKNQTGVEPTASTTSTKMYRKDIDANNQAIYISKIENGQVVKVRVT